MAEEIKEAVVAVIRELQVVILVVILKLIIEDHTKKGNTFQDQGLDLGRDQIQEIGNKIKSFQDLPLLPSLHLPDSLRTKIKVLLLDPFPDQDLDHHKEIMRNTKSTKGLRDMNGI